MRSVLLALCFISLECEAGEPIQCTGHEGSANTVSFSPDGKLLASGGDEGVVHIWNANDGSEVRTVRIDAPIRQVLFAPNGMSLAVCSTKKGITFWDPLSGAKQDKGSSFPNVAISASFSKDGSQIAVGEGQAVLVFNSDTGKPTHDFRLNDLSKTRGLPYRVPFSPDGTLVAGCSSVWRLNDNKEFIFLKEPFPQARCFSPDGKILLTLQAFCKVTLWQSRTWQHVRSIEAFDTRIYSAIYSPDGETIAACGSSPDIKFFDAATGELVKTLSTKSDQITDIDFSQDGQRLASAGRDGTVLIWRIEPKEGRK
jgi:WD40 repeat protein